MNNIEDKIDYDVGKLAAWSMCGVIFFIMLQIFIAIPCTLILELVPEEQANIIVPTLSIFLELVLICSIIFIISKKAPKSKFYIGCEQKETPYILRESNLELLINIATIIGIFWILLIGMDRCSIKIFVTVVNGFLGIFLMIFLLLRFYITDVINSRTFLSIILII